MQVESELKLEKERMLFLEDYFLEEEIKELVANNYYSIIAVEVIEE